MTLFRPNGERLRLKRTPGTRDEALALAQEKMRGGGFTHAWFGQFFR